MVSEPDMPSTQKVASWGTSSLHPELLPLWFSEERSGPQRWQLLQSEGTSLKNAHDANMSPNFAPPLSKPLF